jgi:serine/threonine protein kinase
MIPLSPGLKLKNRYQIIRLIGRGGQCVVYLAYDQFTGKNIVIKCLIDQFQKEEEKVQYLQLFLKEHLFLSRLEHPSLPKAYEQFEENGKYYVVVEFVPGQGLDKVIESSRTPLNEKKEKNFLQKQKKKQIQVKFSMPLT